ncbi:DUF3006 domain-containing protein [Exiguobacterium sp. TDN 0502]|uniref:DUF3006 domain-containing protein n=1 Tax=Exiguobacterium sp. TDN 0502 TaxID=3420731 RepID=UPI003D772072
MRLTLSDFEEDLAICETDDRETITLPKNRLPRQATIGDRLDWTGRSIRILREETDTRKKEITDLMDDLFEE